MADLINHPAHYKGANGLEVIDVIDNFDLGFVKGNACKYLLRAGHKVSSQDVAAKLTAEAEDLKKAQWYLARRIAECERGAADWQKLEATIARRNRAALRRLK